MTRFILLSYLLLSLSVGIDCWGIADSISKKLFGKQVQDKVVKFNLFKSISEGYSALSRKKYVSVSEEYTVDNPLNISTIFTNFSRKSKTKILVHGWNDLDNGFSESLKEAFTTNHEYNVIIVDWNESGGNLHSYNSATYKVSRVAKQIATIIERLCSEFDLFTKHIHVIGHGLGAHIAGLTGKYLTIGMIGRVTGLDPTKSGFDFENPDKRISTDSARFVDIIHTCGGHLGTPNNIGHIDFYPNGGSWQQPGCGLDWKGYCSQQRSYLYYAESIVSPERFAATLCENWNVYRANGCRAPETLPMGEFTPVWKIPLGVPGTFYLHTNSKAPFSKD